MVLIGEMMDFTVEDIQYFNRVAEEMGMPPKDLLFFFFFPRTGAFTGKDILTSVSDFSSPLRTRLLERGYIKIHKKWLDPAHEIRLSSMGQEKKDEIVLLLSKYKEDDIKYLFQNFTKIRNGLYRIFWAEREGGR